MFIEYNLTKLYIVGLVFEVNNDTVDLSRTYLSLLSGLPSNREIDLHFSNLDLGLRERVKNLNRRLVGVSIGAVVGKFKVESDEVNWVEEFDQHPKLI